MKNNQINDNKIGILILSYNSIETIKDTIKSTYEFANQIVVVDSGSDDGTPELVSRMGCEIYFRKWTDNFSEQRNFALKHLRSKWVLMLDSDEYLTNFDYKKFLEIDSDNNIAGINFIIKNYVDNSNAQLYHRYTRMFRNNSNFCFSGKIHEQIRDSIENYGYEIIDSEFEITHTGYSKINENKIERNLKMLADELINEPDNDFVKFHLASTYFAKGDIEQAGLIFHSIINSFQLSTGQLDMLYIRLAQIYLRKDDYEKVGEYTKRIPTDKNLQGLRNYILSSVKLEKNELREAYNLMTDKDTLQSSLIDKEILNKTIETLRKIM